MHTMPIMPTMPNMPNMPTMPNIYKKNDNINKKCYSCQRRKIF